MINSDTGTQAGSQAGLPATSISIYHVDTPQGAAPRGSAPRGSAPQGSGIATLHKFVQRWGNASGVLILFTSNMDMQRYYAYNLRRGGELRQYATTSLVDTFVDFARTDTFATPMLPSALRVILLHRSTLRLPVEEVSGLFAYANANAEANAEANANDNAASGDVASGANGEYDLLENENLGDLSSWWHKYANVIRLFDDLLLGGVSFEQLLGEAIHSEVEGALVSASKLYHAYLDEVHGYGYHDKTEYGTANAMDATYLQDYPNIVVYHQGELEFSHMAKYTAMAKPSATNATSTASTSTASTSTASTSTASTSTSGGTPLGSQVHLLLTYTDHATEKIVRQTTHLPIAPLPIAPLQSGERFGRGDAGAGDAGAGDAGGAGGDGDAGAGDAGDAGDAGGGGDAGAGDADGAVGVINGASITVVQVPTPGEEFHLMLQRVNRLKAKYGAGKVAIVALNSATYNWFLNFDKGRAFRLYSGEPLASTALFQLLHTLSVPSRYLLKGRSTVAVASTPTPTPTMSSQLYLRLVANPLFCQGSDLDIAEVCADVINSRTQHVCLLEESAKYADRSPLFASINTFFRTITDTATATVMSSEATATAIAAEAISGYIRGVRTLTTELLSGSPYRLDEKSTNLANLVLYRLVTLELMLANNRTLFDVGDSTDYFLDIFWNYLRNESWTPTPASLPKNDQDRVLVAPIEVLSGSGYRAIVVPFMNEDVFPPKKAADIFLNISLRDTLGLPTHLRHTAYLKWQLSRAINSAEECYISYSDNAHRRRSTLIDELALGNTDIVETAESASDALLFGYTKPMTPASTDASNAPDYREGVDSVAKTPNVLEIMRNMAFSATSIDTYNKCSMMFYYQYILKLRQADSEVAQGLEPREIGTALHALMETITLEKVATMSEHDLASLFDPQALNLPISNMQPWDKLKIDADIYTIPHDVYKIMTKRRSEGFQTIGTELDLKSDFHGYTLKGFVDRVEGTPERVDIIDFKFKKVENIDSISATALKKVEETGEFSRVKSYQHCVYAILVENFLKQKGDKRLIHGLYFMTIKNKGVLVPYLPKPKGSKGTDTQEGLEILENALKELLDEVNDPDVPFAKTKKISTCQQYCPYQIACGKGLPRKE